jgi:hypothetical protein
MVAESSCREVGEIWVSSILLPASSVNEKGIHSVTGENGRNESMAPEFRLDAAQRVDEFQIPWYRPWLKCARATERSPGDIAILHAVGYGGN